MALYSASAEDLDTIACFFDFQEINESPRKMQYPVIDLLVSRHDAQSASLNPLTSSSDFAKKKTHFPGSSQDNEVP